MNDTAGLTGYILSPLIAATMAVILIILVLQAGLRDRPRRLFLLVLSSLALWAAFTFGMRSSRSLEAAVVWDRIVSAWLICLFVTFYHFCHVYTGHGTRWPVRLLYSLAVPSTAVVLFTGLAVAGMRRAGYGYDPVVGPGGFVIFGAVYLLIVLNTIVLVRAWMQEPSEDRRKRYLWLAAAGLLPLLGIVADGFTDLPPVLIWANLAFATVCTFAILRYRLIDLRVVARRGLVRVLVSALIAAPFVGAIILARDALRDRSSSLAIYALAMVAFALILWPTYEWARLRVDRLFQRERHDYLDSLRELVRGADAAEGFQAIALRLTELVRGALGASTVSLLQPLGDSGDFHLAATTGDGQDRREADAQENPERAPASTDSFPSRVLGSASPIVDWLYRSRSALRISTLAVEPLLQNIPMAEKTALRGLTATLLVPLISPRGSLAGVLVLGPKASRRGYSSEDVLVLDTIGAEAALALENTRLYRDAVRTRQTLEAWLNNLPDSVIITDREGEIRFANREASALFAIRVGQRSFLRAPAQEQSPRRYTETILGREYEIACAPLLDPDGRLHSMYVMRDITERREEQAHRKQIETRARLASHLASIGEMAAGIAHEINNPLTAVIGYSQLLGMRTLPEEVNEIVRQILQGSHRVAGIVKRLLTFARQQKPLRTAVSLNEIIQSTLALRDYALRTGNIRVTTELDPGLPVTIADGQQMQQVLLNLIINAETAMGSAHGKGALFLKSEYRQGAIHIVVRDNGPGVPSEIRDRIFDPFFTTREVGQGTGLGLSVCHGIMGEHDGRIWVEGDPGRGAEFHIEFPVVAPGEENREPAVAEEKPPAPPTRILVVDDEHPVRMLLKSVLEKRGHEVDVVPDGRSALERIASQRYGLVFLDIRMPGLSGIEVYRRIRDIAGSLARRVIFLTGDVMAQETTEFLQQAGAPMVTKPFQVPDLLAAVERILQ